MWVFKLFDISLWKLMVDLILFCLINFEGFCMLYD